MRRKWGDRVEFVMIYIREAHPIDGSFPQGGGGDPVVEDPGSLEERTAVAQRLLAACDFGGIRTLVDGVDDATARAWGAAPVRLYLVDAEGKVAWRGGPGPKHYKPEELRAAIEKLLEPASKGARP